MTLKGQGRDPKHLRLNISTTVPYKLQQCDRYLVPQKIFLLTT